MPKKPVIWVAAYISSKHLPNLKRDLERHNAYRNIKTFIPTIRVLDKRYKGKEVFQEVPFLFNYGFFRLPKYFIPNSHFLRKMKEDIGAIYSWVTDKCAVTEVDYSKPRKYFLHNPAGVAIVSRKDIIKIKKAQSSNSIYNEEDVKNLYPGKIIVLKGYPFDDLEAEVVSINTSRREVEVKLLLHTHITKVKVSFENVFYTIYKDAYMNTEMREESIEGFKHRFKNQ